MNYKTIKCPFCGDQITNGGAARTSHMRKHVRKDGLQEEETDKGLVWKKGKKVYSFEKSKKKEPIVPDNSHRLNIMKVDKPVKPEVMVTKKGLVAFCAECGTKTKSRLFRADERFDLHFCKCGKLYLVSHREKVGAA